jgi:putative inorganic carbon (hco3(-)) transporter
VVRTTERGEDNTKVAAEVGVKSKRYNSISKSLCFVVFFLIPFLGGNHLALPGITIDRFWIETSFLLALIIAICIGFLRGSRPESRYSTFILYFAPFLIVSGLSLIYTWSTYNTVRELNILIWVLGVVYLWALSTDKELPVRALVWGSVATVVCAILQFKVLFPHLAETFASGWYASILQEKPVPFAAFLNENMFGGFLLLVLPISVFLGIHQHRRLYLVAVPMLVVGVLLSLSRLSAVAMTCELLVMGVIFVFSRQYGAITKLVGSICVAAFLFFLLIHFQGSPSEKRVEQSFKGKTTAAFSQVRTLNLRTSIWQAANEAFQERPLIGHGAGAFEYGYRKHFGGRLYTRYSHGAVAKIAVELGILGLLASLWYLFGLVRGVRKRALASLFLLTAIVGGLLFALADCALDTAAFVVAFFAISSFLLIPGRLDVPLTGKGHVVPVLVLLVLSFAFTGRADLTKKTVEEGLLFEEIGNPSAAAISYVQAAALMPIDNEPRIRYMTLLTGGKIVDRSEQERQTITEALEDKWNRISLRRDKDSEAFFLNALGNKILGRDAVAVKYMNEAMELYPSSTYYASQAADWLVSAGHYGEADAVIQRLEPFLANIRTWGNPYGLYVYRLRELSADIEFEKGNVEKAVALGEQNLKSARNEEFIITSYKAREFVRKESLVGHLVQKLAIYRTQLPTVRSE